MRKKVFDLLASVRFKAIRVLANGGTVILNADFTAPVHINPRARTWMVNCTVILPETVS